jgi:ketosteroid isomerase-like protein
LNVTERHEAAEVFEAVLAAGLGSRDVDAALSYFAEDAVLTDYSDAGAVYTGRAAIREVIQGFLDALPDVRYEITELVASNDQVAAAVLIRATPEEGAEPVEFRLCAFDVVRDGKIVSEHLYGPPVAAGE